MAKEKSENKPSLWERWRSFISGKGDARPDAKASYGGFANKTVILLPKHPIEQMKLVNMMFAMDEYRTDWRLKQDFLNEILPLTTYCGQTVTVDILGYVGIDELITLYCDLLLRPLSQRSAANIEKTILTLLPTLPESKES